ncbi:MAG: DoxX family protein [Pseudomonadota bacterium]
MIREWLFLEKLSQHADVGLLIMRVLTGAFLVYGVVDNVVSAEQMANFAAFLEANGFALPGVMAPLSVYFQLLAGLALIVGLLTRWTGILIAIHFMIAVVMVHWTQDFRGWWPAIVLVGIGLQFAFTGAGRFSLDARVTRKKN